MEKPVCETCGECPQEVQLQEAGLCGECWGASIAQIIKEATGDHICGRPLYHEGKVVAICAQPYGCEHEHGAIAY